MSQDLDPTQDVADSVDPAERSKEPIFPEGQPMRIPKDAVQLTFFAPDSIPRYNPQEGEPDDDELQGVELRTPIGIKLPVFEGPLDLLLHLIKRDRLEIYDIPIAHITEEYLATLGLMQVLDLEVAGDFLVMAATLMRIKARMLLPVMPEDDDEDGDPRHELVQQLLEYRRFKEAASRLQDQETYRRNIFGRGWLPEPPASEEPVELAPMPHYVLIDVMKDVLARVGEEFFYEVELEDVSIEEKIALILQEVKEQGRILFADLVARTPRRLHIVVSFMAILELSRLGKIALAQESNFGQLWVYRVSGAEPGEASEAGEGDHHGTA